MKASSSTLAAIHRRALTRPPVPRRGRPLLILGVASPARAGSRLATRRRCAKNAASTPSRRSSAPPDRRDAVLGTLTDYENIPRFMPAVRTQPDRRAPRRLRRRRAGGRRQLLMFSRRIHLVLEVSRAPGMIRFRDRCGRSFKRYEGTWTVADRDGRTVIAYRLARSRPSTSRSSSRTAAQAGCAADDRAPSEGNRRPRRRPLEKRAIRRQRRPSSGGVA